MSGEAPRRLIVLGAGITGLSAAYEALAQARRSRRQLEVLVLEASDRIGGKVVTESREGAVLEGGPDSFLTTKPQVLELVDELGLSGELVATDPRRRSVFIFSGGRLHRLPAGGGFWPRSAWPWLGSGLLSWRAKARLAAEPWVPPLAGEEDESLAAFTRRRLGAELLDKLVGPVFAGIYAGDAETLSVQSAFPQLKELERRGGLVKAAAGAGAQPGRSLFMTLKGGLSRLTEALALRLPPRTVRTGARVTGLSRRGRSWQVLLGREALSADAVISTLPAPALSETLSDLDLELATILREIPFASTATVSFLYDAAGFPDPLDGYGFLVPRAEGRTIVGATYTSSKFAGRAPAGSVLIRCFVGGAGKDADAEADDAAVARSARADLREILRLGDRHPKLTRVHRWIKANPQYTVGHSLRLKRIDSCLKGHPGLHLAGCSYEGVGLPDCVRSGREAARRAVGSLASFRTAVGVE